MKNNIIRTVAVVVAAVGIGAVGAEAINADGTIPTLSSTAYLREARRVVDTRAGDTLPAALTGVPPWADAALVSIAVVNPTGDGFVTLWDCDGTPPPVAHLNFTRDDVVESTFAVAPLSPADELCVFASADTDVVVDVQGWTRLQSSYYLP